MATRCTIGIQYPDDSVEYVYCHNDGDVAFDTLKSFYNSYELAQKLINHGDMSVLDANIHPTNGTHCWDSPQSGVCVFYCRDRGESFDISCPVIVKNAAAYKKNAKGKFDYYYLFKDGKWSQNGNY